MATRSSMLYLMRKKTVLRRLANLPHYPPARLNTHFRPHDVLPELRNLEKTNNRLATKPLTEVLGQIERTIQTD